MRSPAMTASYSASLLDAVNSNFKAYVNFVPFKLTTIKPALEPSPLDASSVYIFHLVVCSACCFFLKSVSSSSSLVSARKSARIWALTAFLGLKSIPWSPSSMAHLATLPDFLGFDNKSLIGLTALIHSFEAAKQTIKFSLALGATRVGRSSMYLFISSKDLSAYLVHVKSFLSRQPFNDLKKELAFFHPKRAFLWIEFHVYLSKPFKGKMQVCDKKHGKWTKNEGHVSTLRRNTSYGYTVKSSKPINRGLIQTLRHQPSTGVPRGDQGLHSSKNSTTNPREITLILLLYLIVHNPLLLWFRLISFNYRVPLGFGTIAGGLDHVNPVIRLPIEHGISRGTRVPGVVKPEIRGNVNFDIKSQFMRELREDTLSENKNEDAHLSNDRVLQL
ncbi:hypothetical protein Tco_0723284 [Tanacetum coccineum]